MPHLGDEQMAPAPSGTDRSNTPAVINVMYPAKAGSTFNLDYYVNRHLPLAMKHWGKFGLRSWVVTKLDESSGWFVQCILFFDSVEGFERANKEEVTEVMEDVPNFSSEMPVRWISSLEGNAEGMKLF